MKKIKKLLSMMVMVILVSLLVACSNDKKNDESNNSNYSGNNDKSLNGSITMSGSTSMEKLSNVLAEAFMTKYPEVIVNAEFVGSSAGIEQVLAGAVDIGNASRNLKTSEKEAGAVENVVAMTGLQLLLIRLIL